jgi:hypothetical protein
MQKTSIVTDELNQHDEIAQEQLDIEEQEAEEVLDPRAARLAQMAVYALKVGIAESVVESRRDATKFCKNLLRALKIRGRLRIKESYLNTCSHLNDTSMITGCYIISL